MRVTTGVRRGWSWSRRSVVDRGPRPGEVEVGLETVTEDVVPGIVAPAFSVAPAVAEPCGRDGVALDADRVRRVRERAAERGAAEYIAVKLAPLRREIVSVVELGGTRA